VGAYNGLFLTLDRMFLHDTLQRCGRIVATTVTLFIGWALFRCEQPSQLLPFLGVLFGMSRATAALDVPAEVPLTLFIGALVSLFPATPLYPLLLRAHQQLAWLRWVTVAALVLIYVLALARAFASRFSPSSISGSDRRAA
jgi:alginate O-acetyltransferase complex protein AlgI